MSKYLMKSAAAIVLGLAATACSHDLDVVERAEQQSLDNAQATLGFYIPEDQDWKMSSEASINVTIPGDANQTYTVMVFANNPLEDGIGYYLTKQTLNGGHNLLTDFSYPSHLKSFVVGITDSNNVTTYKSANVVNGQITTLTNLGSTTASRTRGVYTNANQWAAPKDGQNIQTGWLVPTPLSSGQKERVYRYFQTHPYLGYIDPEWDNFFVQQVYEGADDVLTPEDNLGPVLSSEMYKQASSGSEPFEGSENMDYLTFGSNDAGDSYFDHCNNFNSADGGFVNVLKKGEPLNGGEMYRDQIMLMYQSRTDCVGFHDTHSNTRHFNNHCALVSYAVIDAWADSVKTAKGITIGEPVTDEWKRSFVGLDYEASLVETAYARNLDNSIRYATMKDFATTSVQYAYLGKNENNEDIFVAWDDYTGKDDYLTFPNGDPVPCLDVNTSEILGDVQGGGKNAYTHNMQVPEYDEQNKQWNNQGRNCLDIPMLKELAALNGMPNLRDELKFIVNPGGRDYVYSDWIVTLSEAKQDGIINHDPLVWSYAFEDNRARCDFDMNDVVLRVNINKKDENKLDITLVAAGCEYDNYVFLNGQLITWGNGKSEVHDVLGAAKGLMVNTGRGVSKTPVTVTVDRNNIDPADAPFSIWPYKKDGEYNNPDDQKETSAIPVTQLEGSGKAPLGIIVPGKWAWPTERTIITEAYSKFVKWATNVVHIEDTNNPDTDWYDYPTNGKVVVIQ